MATQETTSTTTKRTLIRPEARQTILAFAGLILIFLVFFVASPYFRKFDNIVAILLSTAVNGVLALGVTFVIITGGIDLSIGTILTFSAVMTGVFVVDLGLPVPLGVILGLLSGALCGLINGFVIAKMKVPPFIATLGMMTFARGAAKFYTDGQPISGLDQLGQGFRLLGTAEPLGIPMPIIVAGLVFLAGYVLLNHIPFGRYIFGLGDNEEAAYLSGLPVRLIKMFVYVAAGALSALAGIILVGRLNSAQPTAGEMYEFDAIAAVVVGGTSFDGGEGTIMGTLIGVLIIGIIDNGLNLLDISSFYQDITKGAVIALALLLHRAIR